MPTHVDEQYAVMIRERNEQVQHELASYNLGSILGGPHPGCGEFDPGPSEDEETRTTGLDMFLVGLREWAAEAGFDLPEHRNEDLERMGFYDNEDDEISWQDAGFAYDNDSRDMVLVMGGDTVLAAYGAGRACLVNAPVVRRLLAEEDDA